MVLTEHHLNQPTEGVEINIYETFNDIPSTSKLNPSHATP